MTELIEIHVPLLRGVPTVKALPGYIGWIKDDKNKYWEKLLRERFCAAVGKALHQCGADPITNLGDNYVATIFKDIPPATNSPLVWPPPIPSDYIEHRPPAFLLPYCPEEKSLDMGYTLSHPNPPSPPHGGLLSDYDDPNYDFTDLLKDAEMAVANRNKDIEEDVAVFRAERALSVDEVDADIFAHPEARATASNYEQETPVSNKLATESKKAMQKEKAYISRAHGQSQQLTEPKAQPQRGNTSWQTRPSQAPSAAQQVMSPTSAFFSIPPVRLPTEHIFEARKVAKGPPAESHVSSRGDMGSRYHQTPTPSGFKTMRITPERKTSERGPSPISTQADPLSPAEISALDNRAKQWWPPNMHTAFREPSCSEPGDREASTVADLDEDVTEIPPPLPTPVPQPPRHVPRSQSQGSEDRQKAPNSRQSSSRAIAQHNRLEVIDEIEHFTSPTSPTSPTAAVDTLQQN
ncbi:hypothetical protein DFP73DRAFT_532495 [Morchella snyderi]|nr:hypothetical protein DFP73DRAFT_532495 [Morchella snyderi]